jgi:hypothetical protein
VAQAEGGIVANEPNEEVVAVIEGPNGKAEIFEISVGRRLQYEVRFGGQAVRCESLGEAYIEAGQKAGRNT